MKRLTSLLPLFVLVVSSVAAANSVPVFDLTQGSVTITSNTPHGYPIIYPVWTFGNNGISISGSTLSWAPDACLVWAPASSSCDPSIAITNNSPTPNIGTVSDSNSGILFLGGVGISGASFLPPTGSDLTAYSVTMPVLFSGSFNACVTAYGGAVGCNDASFQPTPVFGVFNVNGTGTASLSFVNLGIPGNTPIWRLSSGTYTLYSTPEPSGITLACVGAMGLVLMLRFRLLS